MFNHSIEARAMLIFHNPSSGVIDLTVHDVLPLPKNDDIDQPQQDFTLGAGRVLGEEEKGEIVSIIGNEQRQSLALMDDRILARTPYALAWWMPSQAREFIFKNERFRPDSDEPKYVRVKVTMPTTIGVYCRGELRFACVKRGKRQRPGNDTPLFLPPLPNIYSSGSFCRGNVPIANGANEANIADWERFLVDSVHTHLGTVPVEQIKGKPRIEGMTDLVALFQEHEGTGRFPLNRLSPMHCTLGEWLTRIDQGRT